MLLIIIPLYANIFMFLLYFFDKILIDIAIS